MLKMLKIGCFKLFKAKSLYLRYTSRYSHGIFCSTVVKVRLLWPVSHIFAVVCSKICFFKYFSSWKILKMLRIGCFNLFLAKSLYLMYVSRYSHPIFYSTVVKVRLLLPVSQHIQSGLQQTLFFKFFNCWKLLKMLKIGCFMQNHSISCMPSRYSHAIFCSTVVKVRLLWPVSHIFAVICSKICFLKFSVAGKSSKCLE